MSTRFDTYEEAYYFASTRTRDTGLANGIERTTEFGKDGFNVRFLPRPDKRFGWELRCESVEPGSPILYVPSPGSMSQADLAHERRMFKRQLRRAGVEWDRDLPNTADALQDQIRALGIEPMEVCFHRSIECPACVLPAGHEGPHEPATVKAAEPKPESDPKPESQKPTQKTGSNVPTLGLFKTKKPAPKSVPSVPDLSLFN